MARPRSRIDKLVLILVFGFFGVVIGLIADSFLHLPTLNDTAPPRQRFCLPQHIPRYPGNLTLRYAMVHDVLHERFARHGKDYYVERNRRVKEALKKESPDKDRAAGDRSFALVDDLGVGLCLVGQYDDAVALLRDKLRRQESLGYQGRDLYSTYANLGTFLVLWQLSEGLDKPQAKERLRESIRWLHQAIKVYPESHFGREQWQVVLEGFLLAVSDKPDLLLKFDMIGNRLDLPVVRPSFKDYTPEWVYQEGWLACADYLARPEPAEKAKELRERYIRRVGAEQGWEEVGTSLKEPVLFDEPTLGIIGMWRLGAGANPFFSLALGEIMWRVNQRYLAWYAFERSYQMKEGISANPKIQEQLASHCRARQVDIQRQLPGENWNAVREQLNDELHHGRTYQAEYQAYETQRIQAGSSIDDPHFYDDFEKDRPPIATPVGEEDAFVPGQPRPIRVPLPAMVLGAGVFAFGTALLLRVPARSARDMH